MPDSNQTRIECGSYFADVLQATSGNEPFWYYIIQLKGSKGIIDLLKFDTQEKAIARNALVKFSRAATAN